MKKFINWVINHQKSALAIVTFGVTLIVIGVTMLTSYTSFKAYEKRHDEADLAFRSEQSPSAKSVQVKSSYKSKYGNKLVLNAEDLTVTTEEEYDETGYIPSLSTKGGKIDFTFSIEEKSFVDLDLVIRNPLAEKDNGDPTPLEGLLSVVKFSVRGTMMEDEVTLEDNDWCHLVFSGFALAEGDINVSLETLSGKFNYMPDVKSITVYSSVKATLA